MPRCQSLNSDLQSRIRVHICHQKHRRHKTFFDCYKRVTTGLWTLFSLYAYFCTKAVVEKSGTLTNYKRNPEITQILKINLSTKDSFKAIWQYSIYIKL